MTPAVTKAATNCLRRSSFLCDSKFNSNQTFEKILIFENLCSVNECCVSSERIYQFFRIQIFNIMQTESFYAILIYDAGGYDRRPSV